MKRPQYHFTPERNWMNDPNGLIYFGGKYHMFYQHFPYAPKWGTMHWGHAVSDDMVTWEYLPIALFPTKEYDRDGVFSGGAIEKNGKMYLYYTAVKYLEIDPEDTTVSLNGQFEASQAMIISEDGVSFDNFNGKKQIIPPILDESLGHRIHTRDPKVWKFRDKYYMVLGSKIKEEDKDDFTPRLLFYVSDNAENWQLINTCSLFGELGNMWECPDIFSCPNTVLVMSPEQMREENPRNNAVFGIVDFDNSICDLKINSADFRYIDYGLDYYAPQSFVDKMGQRVQFGWLRMEKPIVDDKGQEWIGAMTMPRVVTTELGEIYTRLHPNLKNEFKRFSSVQSIDEPYAIDLTLKKGESIKLADNYSLLFNGIALIATRGELSYEAPIKGEIAELEIYIDSNIIETYINDGLAVISHVL